MDSVYFVHNNVTYCGAPGLSLENLLDIYKIDPLDEKLKVLTLEEYEDFHAPSLESLKARKVEALNFETCESVASGFTYELDGQELHFSYSQHDQQNFSDTANSVILCRLGMGEPAEAIPWNGWQLLKDTDGAITGKIKVPLVLSSNDFLELYTKGALAHKARCLANGARRKEAAAGAASAQELEAL